MPPQPRHPGAGPGKASFLRLHYLAVLESRPKSLSPRPRRDIDVARPRRDRDFEQKLETRPRLERSKTETRYETFETKRL